MTTKSTNAGEGAPPKKPYETPRLEVYGDIREIAKAVGTTGAGDGGGHVGPNKTR